MRAMHTTLVFATALLLNGCAGATPAPKELTQAQAELKRIGSTDTGALAPAELTVARDAVGRAEQAASNGEDEGRVKDLSNAALSRVQIAEARAAEARATQATASWKAEQSTISAAAQNRMLDMERQARKEAEQKTQRQMERLAKLANVKQEQRGYVLTLTEAAMFKTNDAALLPSAKTSLDSIASVIKETDAKSVEINAFVSPKVKKANQVSLSEKRAKAIGDYLATQGIAADRLAPSGKGVAEMVGSGTPADKTASGYVEIVVPAPTPAMAPMPGAKPMTSTPPGATPKP